MTEIKLPKCYKEIDDCEDILKGHCKEYDPHINGYFLSVEQAKVILEALQAIDDPDEFTEPTRDVWNDVKAAIAILTGSEKK